MKHFRILLSITVMLLAVPMPGCSSEVADSDANTQPAVHAEDDHAGDHVHADHDHTGHDHEHDHGEITVDAEDAGLDSSDMVHLDEPPQPESLSAAINQLVELNQTIRNAFEKGEADAAHDPLHEVGHLLGSIEKFGKELELSGEAQKEFSAAVETLFDSFGSLDQQFHGESAETAYADVQDAIDAAIATFKKHAPNQTE